MTRRGMDFRELMASLAAQRSIFHSEAVWIEDGERLAIELKYLTSAVHADVAGEAFQLRSQAAQDLGRYDILKDLVRVERLVAAGLADRGIVVALTNDSTYWRGPGRGTSPNYADLRLMEGRALDGTMAWGPATGAGTMRGREAPIELRGNYVCDWTDYSLVDTGSTTTRPRSLVSGRPDSSASLPSLLKRVCLRDRGRRQ